MLNLKGKKILMVDHEVMYVEKYKDALVVEGVEVVEARDGLQALAVVENESPDIVILNILLPKLSGIDVLQKIKARKETMHIPVVMFSSLNTPEIIQETLKCGASGYIIKGTLAFHQFAKEIERLVFGR